MTRSYPMDRTTIRTQALTIIGSSLALCLACGGGSGSDSPAPVNHAPVFTTNGPTTATTGHPYSYSIATADADGDTVTLTLPVHPTGASLDASTRTISWTPAAVQAGVAQSFDVLANDGKAAPPTRPGPSHRRPTRGRSSQRMPRQPLRKPTPTAIRSPRPMPTATPSP